MTTKTFESLALHPRIVSALKEAGYTEPTDIQAAVIPVAITGQDVMGTARTGTGKTAAFLLPILEQLCRKEFYKEEYQAADGDSSAGGEADASSEKKEGGAPRSRKNRQHVKVLVLSPTRELAQQIEESAEQYGKFLPVKSISVVGGLPIERQIRQLERGVDILIATPGRLLDLVKRRQVNLRHVEYFVLDEADRMLDMGFVHDVRDIAKLVNPERQTFFFSATTSGDVESLAKTLLKNPERIAVHPADTVSENIDSRVLFVDKKDKRALVLHLLKQPDVTRALIFCATKADANVLSIILSKQGIEANAIHSDKSQRDRQRALKEFDEGKVRVLVATDVMARGIDVDGISHVINYDLPSDPENFVHRIGRTARAGTKGIALALCDLDEVKMLNSIEQFTKQTIEVDSTHPFHSPFVETMKNRRESPFARRGGRGGAGRGSVASRGGRRRFG